MNPKVARIRDRVGLCDFVFLRMPESDTITSTTAPSSRSDRIPVKDVQCRANPRMDFLGQTLIEAREWLGG